MKGQVFTLDILAALILITVVLGCFTYEFEKVSAKASDIEYQKMQMIASDVSQIGAKRALVSGGQPNYVAATRFSDFVQLVGGMFGNYGGFVSLGTLNRTINNGCEGRADVAVSQRLVLDSADSKVKWLKVEVCS